MDNTETKIDAYCYTNNRDNKSLCRKVEYSQRVTFLYDSFTKGKIVAMRLTANGSDAIDAPGLDIYFKNEDLKKILEFLIENEK